MKIESRVNSLEKEMGKEDEAISMIWSCSRGPVPRLPDGSYDYQKITGGRHCRHLLIIDTGRQL